MPRQPMPKNATFSNADYSSAKFTPQPSTLYPAQWPQPIYKNNTGGKKKGSK